MTDQSVQLAYPYKDADGKDHEPDAVVTLEAAEAARLLHHGLARVPDSTSATKKKG